MGHHQDTVGVLSKQGADIHQAFLSHMIQIERHDIVGISIPADIVPDPDLSDLEVIIDRDDLSDIQGRICTGPVRDKCAVDIDIIDEPAGSRCG